MEKFKIQKKLSDNKETIDIVVSGDLSIKHSDFFFKELKEIKKVHKTYNILLMDIAQIDIMCLQVLISFMIYLRNNDKEVNLKKELSEEMNQLLRNADMLSN